MRKVSIGLCVAILAVSSCCQFSLAQQSALPAKTRTPVLVELFTSEGCSTCPPADRLLINLKQNQPVPGVEVVALGFHVDYWDRKEWKDRFSSQKFTERQKRYASQFHDDVYTPQMIVDGVRLVTDSHSLPTTLLKAANEPKSLRLAMRRNQENVEIEIKGTPGSSEAFVALVEDDLNTSVKGGENQGRTLQHAAVVRDWRSLGRITKDDWLATTELKVPVDSARSKLQVIVFAQDPATGKVLGLAVIPFGQ